MATITGNTERLDTAVALLTKQLTDREVDDDELRTFFENFLVIRTEEFAELARDPAEVLDPQMQAGRQQAKEHVEEQLRSRRR